jgi:hypothetical protein
VIVGADHDRVAHAAEHARGIRHRLAAPELRRAAIEDQRGAAQLAHRHIERHARAGRVLLEDHREGMTRERRIRIRRALGLAQHARRLAI